MPKRVETKDITSINLGAAVQTEGPRNKKN